MSNTASYNRDTMTHSRFKEFCETVGFYAGHFLPALAGGLLVLVLAAIWLAVVIYGGDWVIQNFIPALAD